MPQRDTSNICKSRLQKAANGLKTGGDALIAPGLVLAGAGLAVGPEGAAPGLFIAGLGGLAGTAGQFLEDVIHGDSLATAGKRALANAALGRVAIKGLQAVNGGRAAPVIDDVFEAAIGKGAPSAVKWLEPVRCK